MMNTFWYSALVPALFALSAAVDAQPVNVENLSTVTRVLDSRVPKPAADLLRDEIKLNVGSAWPVNASLLNAVKNVYLDRQSVQKVTGGQDVVTVDPSKPNGVATPCDNDRPDWSQPNPDALDFYKQHGEVTKGVVAIIAWQPELRVWQVVGSGALVRPNVLLTVRHVAEAAGALKFAGAGWTTSREAWAVFDANDVKFPDGIPAAYDPSKDAAAFRIQTGSSVRLPADIRLDLALLRVPLQTRQPLSLGPSSVAAQTRLAVVGVPDRPSNDDASDPRAGRVFSVCGHPKDSWPVALRIGTGAYIGADADARLFRFAVSTVGGDSGSVVVDAASGNIIGVTIGTPEGAADFYNLAVGNAEISSLLAAL